MDDRALLREYVEHHSEPAFAELVARHLPGVLATAQRLVREPQAAADVAQTVFIQLARKAWTIREGQAVSGWLYRTTRHVAFNALRMEQRRQQRETTAMKDSEVLTGSDSGWEDLAPLVDEALRQLKRPEQDVVLLRFFEGKSFAEIGHLLHLDEKTAGQRAHRALEKMRRYFSRQGMTTTAVLLGSALGAHGATTLPTGLTTQVAGISLAAKGGTTSLALLLKTLYMTTSTKLAIAAAILVTAATVSTIVQQREISTLRAELAGKSAAAGTSTKKAPLTSAEIIAQVKATIAELRKIPRHEISAEKIHDYFAGLDDAIIQALVADTSATSLLKENTYERGVLIERWATMDHAAALSWALKFDNDKSTLIDIYDSWSESDPAGALAALPQLQLKGEDYSNALTYMIDNYFAKDPAAAFAELSKLPYSQTFLLYPKAFEIWAEKDPAAASVAALNLPPSHVRDTLFASIAGTWAETDPAAVLAWVKTLPASPAIDEALADVVIIMSQRDPSATAAAFASYNIPPGQDHDNALKSLASNFAEKDPAGALQWANASLTGKDYQTAITSALLAIGKTDPAAAAADMAKITDPGVIDEAAMLILGNWGSQDPQAALAWAQALPADNVSLRSSAIAEALRSWTNTDPAAAGNYVLQNFTSDPSFNTLAKQVVSSWVNSDPQGAFTWAKSLPTGGGTRINAITTALGALASVDVQAAWQDAQSLTGGSNAPRAEASVISAWANQQPAQAAAALQSIPEGSDLNTATGNVAKSWLSQDPNAASQWIDTLPQGAARDAAVTQIISTVGTSDPAGAFKWAVSIGDATTRNNQMVKLATQWSNQNPAAAAAAAQNALSNLSGLTPAQQTALQKVVAKAPAP